MPALITLKGFCDEFKVSRSTAYRLHERGDLPFVYIGRSVRIRREDAALWFASLAETRSAA